MRFLVPFLPPFLLLLFLLSFSPSPPFLLIYFKVPREELSCFVGNIFQKTIEGGLPGGSVAKMPAPVARSPGSIPDQECITAFATERSHASRQDQGPQAGTETWHSQVNLF